MDQCGYIKEQFQALGMELSQEQAEQFQTYYEMLLETNKVMNLTAITEFEEVVDKHFVDSALSSRYFPFDQVQTVIDVGTGAGFPGIPLKILYPHLSMTLLDSLGKRVKFLQTVVDNLSLTAMKLIHGRAEDFGRDPEYREQFEVCVSRAVANLSTLSEYCTPFVKVGGAFLSYKSGNVDEELETAKPAIKILGCKTKKVERFSLDEAGRSLVWIEKKEKLQKKYPRKAGVPSKQPL